uniref:Uncharacterized protein n=1 Tax=Clytia hemisphaerica TaxID=252671 RepID=A0A7M5V7J2_9CNID
PPSQHPKDFKCVQQTAKPACDAGHRLVILYYHSGEKDPKVVWHGSVTKLGKSTFNGTLIVNIIENTGVVVEFSNIQEAMVLYLMVHFVDDKSGEMHAFYSNIKIFLKGLFKGGPESSS